MGAKMQIMAWDAKRQMEIKMQKTIEALVMQKRLRASENGGDATGITLLTQAELQQAPLLILKVHRNNLIEESLTQVWDVFSGFSLRMQKEVYGALTGSLALYTTVS
jgi:hypothetical protein